MTWLIRLYPPAWRRRYGEELAELLATQPTSFRTGIDLVAGAIDAWFNPQSSTTAVAADPKGTPAMIPKMLQLRGFGHGTTPTVADSIKSAAVTIGGSLAVVLAIWWARRVYGNNPYLESFAVTLWIVPMLIGMSFTELKGRSALVKAVFIGVPSAIVVAIAMVNAG